MLWAFFTLVCILILEVNEPYSIYPWSKLVCKWQHFCWSIRLPLIFSVWYIHLWNDSWYCTTLADSIKPLQLQFWLQMTGYFIYQKIQIVWKLINKCDAIKHEFEIGQIQLSFFWLTVYITCKATFNNRSHWNWSIGFKDTGSGKVAKNKNKKTNNRKQRNYLYLAIS